MNDIKETKEIEEKEIKNENNSENTLSILEDKLPSRLIIIPVIGKPLFPGRIRSISNSANLCGFCK